MKNDTEKLNYTREWVAKYNGWCYKCIKCEDYINTNMNYCSKCGNKINWINNGRIR